MKIVQLVTEKRVCLFSIIALLLTSIFSVGYHHVDEHYQILEFAALKLDLRTAANLPWEYFDQIRPTIQPAIVVCLYKFLAYFGINNPFFVAFLLRFLSAILTFTSMYLFYKLYKDKISHPTFKKWFLVLTFLLWFSIYNGVRFSSENWGGVFFTIAFAFFFLIKKKNIFFYLAFGSILGFSFLFRYQVGFLILGFLAWLLFINKTKVVKLSIILSGIILIIGLGLIIDRWYYGEWTITTWNYFKSNIIKDMASSFGVSPWWYYLKEGFIKMIPPFSLLIIVPIILLPILKIKNPITWSLIPFVLVHTIIGHKELRFLFPIIGFLPIVIIMTLEGFGNSIQNNPYWKLFMQGFFFVNFILLLVTIVRPPSHKNYLLKLIYKHYKTPTTLYYIGDSPYSKDYEVHFYKRPNLRVEEIKTLDEAKNIPGQNELIILHYSRRNLGAEKKYQLIYSSYPDWLTDIEFTDRFRRKTWFVYDIEKNL